MNIEHARLFLSRVLPWGNPNVFVNIHAPYMKPGAKKPVLPGRACTSLQEALDYVAYRSRSADGGDIYVCMSTQKSCQVRQAANGREWRAAVRGQYNVDAISAFWMDIDVTAGHANEANYPSQQAAAGALAEFLKASGVPAPSIVNDTGSGGLHCYWTLGEPLALEEWQPLANALAEGARRHGLRADTGCTVDSVRLMRVPGTRHLKHGTLATLKYIAPHDYTLKAMQTALAPYMGAKVLPLTPRGKPIQDDDDDELGAGIGNKAPPINLQTVADAGCGFIANALADGGKDYANPLWNLTSLVAVFTEGGRADAHAMASGHASYTPESTDELYDRKVREHKEKNLGWPACQSIENAGCASCAKCPIRLPGSRPLQFGRPSAVPSPQPSQPTPLTDLPEGYSRNPSDPWAISRLVFYKNGKSGMEPLTEHKIGSAWVQENPWMLHFEVKFKTDNKVRQLSVSSAQLMGEKFGAHMGGMGLTFTDADKKAFKEFLVAWMTKLQGIKDAVVSAAPFGWLVNTDGGHVEGFCYGGTVWSDTAPRPSTAAGMQGQHYTPRGKIDPWMDMSNLIASWKSPAHDMLLATAFAAPLVRFSGQNGMLLSTYSTDSARGKTTCLKTAQAVWGHPAGMQLLTDTSVSVLNKMGHLSSLPMYWDELKDESQRKTFVSTLFSLTGGREKSRLTSEAQQRTQGMWQTLLTSASNESILDFVVRANKATPASVLRIYEVIVPACPSSGRPGRVDDMVAKLNDNCGQAGLKYAEFIGKHNAAIHEQVKKFRLWVEDHMNIQQEERFWSATVAVVFMGARYANALGLTQIDEKALLDYLLQGIRGMRVSLKDSNLDLSDAGNVSDIIAAYLQSQRYRNTLKTNRIHHTRGKPPHGSITLIGDLSRLEDINVHIGVQDKRMRVGATHFTNWLDEKGHSPSAIVDMLKSKFGVQKAQGRMGGGTDYSSMVQWLLEFDLSHPEMDKIAGD